MAMGFSAICLLLLSATFGFLAYLQPTSAPSWSFTAYTQYPISEEQVDTYRRNGVLNVGRLFEDDDMQWIQAGLDERIAALTASGRVRSEDLLNLHFTDPWLLRLASHPRVLDIASRLLNSSSLRIFTTRILSKPARTGYQVPWHQDSNYWPLDPLQVTSLWLAVDDVTMDNGPMSTLNFTALPRTRHENLPVEQSGEEGGARFDLNIRREEIAPFEHLAVPLLLKRGEASFHDAWLPHSSTPNRSDRRRCAWIVRYCPGSTKLLGGRRKIFPEGYELVRLR